MDDNNDSITYYEDTRSGMPIIASNINNSKCIVVLGPLFGVKQDGKGIYEEIYKLLQEVDDSLELDDDFQNLYLVEKMSSYNETYIEDMINKAFEKLDTSVIRKDILENLAKIKFNAFINFTQDTFLLDAFDKQKLPYNFTYFSLSKPLEEHEKLSPDVTNQRVPFIYNVFGNYHHKESLIYSYDQFYNFFFCVLGENNIFPPELVKRLSSAKMFLLLGFNLKKWYVPIFITKLCKIGRVQGSSSPMVLAALNNTDKDNRPYVRWLTRYPLQLNFVRDSYMIIDRLMADPTVLSSKMHSSNGLVDSLALSNQEKIDFENRLAEVVENEELESIIDDLKTAFEARKNEEAKTFMVDSRKKLKSFTHRFRSNLLTEEVYDVEVAKISKAVLGYIKE
jgi:hypothetical protein